MAEERSTKTDTTIRDEPGTSPKHPNHLSRLDLVLPSTVISTILSKLDVRSICSAAATCRSLRHCASQTLTFVSSFHVDDIAPSLDLLRPILRQNPYLKSLKLDCARLDDSSIEMLARPSLNEIYLHNCENLSGKLLSQLGEKCRDLRTLYLSSLAERRRLVVQFSDLEELLSGCSHLENGHRRMPIVMRCQPIKSGQ